MSRFPSVHVPFAELSKGRDLFLLWLITHLYTIKSSRLCKPYSRGQEYTVFITCLCHCLLYILFFLWPSLCLFLSSQYSPPSIGLLLLLCFLCLPEIMVHSWLPSHSFSSYSSVGFMVLFAVVCFGKIWSCRILWDQFLQKAVGPLRSEVENIYSFGIFCLEAWNSTPWLVNSHPEYTAVRISEVEIMK